MGVWRLRSTHMIIIIVVFMLRVTTYSSKNTTRSSFCSSARLEKPRKMKSVARVWLLFPMEMKGFLPMSGSKKNSTQFTESTTWPAAVTENLLEHPSQTPLPGLCACNVGCPRGTTMVLCVGLGHTMAGGCCGQLLALLRLLRAHGWLKDTWFLLSGDLRSCDGTVAGAHLESTVPFGEVSFLLFTVEKVASPTYVQARCRQSLQGQESYSWRWRGGGGSAKTFL